jgi:hypothetical protein
MCSPRRSHFPTGERSALEAERRARNEHRQRLQQIKAVTKSSADASTAASSAAAAAGEAIAREQATKLDAARKRVQAARHVAAVQSLVLATEIRNLQAELRSAVALAAAAGSYGSPGGSSLSAGEVSPVSVARRLLPLRPSAQYGAGPSAQSDSPVPADEIAAVGSNPSSPVPMNLAARIEARRRAEVR